MFEIGRSISRFIGPSSDAVLFGTRNSPVTPPKSRQETQIALLTEAGGGVARHILDLHRGLLSRGWNATLIVSPKRFDDRYLAELETFDKKHVRFVEMDRAPGVSDLQAAQRVRAILRKMDGPRILHAHSTKAGILGTLLYSDVQAMAYTPHAFRATDPSLSRITGRALRAVEMTYSRPYDRIIAVSQSEMNYTLRCGVDSDRVTCIPNGIEYDSKVSEHQRKRRAKVLAPLTLGFVGRLSHQKNPLLFIETMAQMLKLGHDVKGIVVGHGELSDEMKASAARAGLADRISWKGAVPARAFLDEMDLMVHTSRYEALPYTLLEAAASLLPIVATDNHGSRSVLLGELSENIVPASAESLCSRIVDLISHQKLWDRQLDLLDQTAYAFSVDQMVGGIERVYQMILRERLEMAQVTRGFAAPAVSRIQPLF